MLLLRRRERDGAVESGNTDNWTVQIVKCFFVDDGRDLARNSARFRVLVQDDHLISLSDGLRMALVSRGASVRRSITSSSISSFDRSSAASRAVCTMAA